MATSKSTTAARSGATAASAAKERRLRQWAAKIVSDLPSDGDDARRVLELAEQLRVQWLAGLGEAAHEVMNCGAAQ
jgi:hypothetical protein